MVLLALQSPSGVFDLETATLVQRLTRADVAGAGGRSGSSRIANFNWVHSQNDDIVIEPLLPETLTPEILAQRQKVALAHETPAQLPHQHATPPSP